MTFGNIAVYSDKSHKRQIPATHTHVCMCMYQYLCVHVRMRVVIV